MTDNYELENDIDVNMSLDDIEDLPGYVTFPTGAFLVSLDKGIEEKTINDRNYFSVEATLKHIIELDDKALAEGEVPPKTGDVQSFLFGRKHLVAMASFKTFCAPIAKKFGLSTIREVIEISKGLDLLIIGVRKSKSKDGEIQYNFQPKKISLDF